MKCQNKNIKRQKERKHSSIWFTSKDKIVTISSYAKITFLCQSRHDISLANLLQFIKKQRIANRRMSKTHIVYIFWMLIITLLSVSSKSISNITDKTQDDRIMELENAVRILDNRVQLLNETTHKGMWGFFYHLVLNATIKQYFRYFA
jgi:hypothetical protein